MCVREEGSVCGRRGSVCEGGGGVFEGGRGGVGGGWSEKIQMTCVSSPFAKKKKTKNLKD